MAEGCKYFSDDAVYRCRDGVVQFGVITKNAEYISSDEEEEKDVLDMSLGSPKVKKGEVVVLWHPNGHGEVISDLKLKLRDRSLKPGDVVKRMDNKKNVQFGYCTKARVHADVEFPGTGSVLTNVPSNELGSLYAFDEEDTVILDSWIGIVSQFNIDVMMKTLGGSRCVMNYEDVLELVAIKSKSDACLKFYTREDIYPNQQLAGPAIVFHSARWKSKLSDVSGAKSKSKSKSNKIIRVTVEKVKITRLTVSWKTLAWSPSCESVDPKVPPKIIEGQDLKRLKLLKVWDCCPLQIGNKKIYVLPDNVELTSKWEWSQKQYNELSNKKGSTRSSKNLKTVPKTCDESSDDNINHLSNDDESTTTASHDACSSEGSEYEDIDDDSLSDSISLSCTSSSESSSCSICRNTKRPSLATKSLKIHQKKLKKSQNKTLHPVMPVPGQAALVDVLSTQTVVDVMWQNGSIEKDIPSSELFPIKNVDDHEFFPGDFVMEQRDSSANLPTNQYGVIQSVNCSARTAQVNWMESQNQPSSSTDLTPLFVSSEEVSVYELKDHPDFNFQPQTVVVKISCRQTKPKTTDADSSPVAEVPKAEVVAGQVVSLSPSGKVEVKWIDGKHSFCYPQELHRVDDYESDGSSVDDSFSSISQSDDSWETEFEETADSCDEAPTSVSKPKRKVLTLAMELTNLCRDFAKIISPDPTTVTMFKIKSLISISKKFRIIDGVSGSTYFASAEIKSITKQLLKKHKKKFEENLDMLTERFGVPAEKVVGLVQYLDMLEMSWEIDTEQMQSNPEYDSDNDRKPVAGGADLSNQENSASASANTIHNSKSDLYFKYVLVLHDAMTKLCQDMNISIDDDDMKSFALILRHCKQLEEARKGSCESSKNVLIDDNESQQRGEGGVESEERPADGENYNEVFENPEICEPGSFQGFSVLESVPDGHKFVKHAVQANDPKAFFKAIQKELSLLQNGIPDGILVKGYDNRMDLFSVMIKGPTRTPYEDGLFLFDLKLPSKYPAVPPLCHYISFCSDRLNPNLYEDGKVCISLLGTWGGKGTEVWTSNSSLRQLLISIQGLILVPEPYFNEPGTESERFSSQGKENSRLYNEMALLKLTQAMKNLVINIPDNFREEIIDHYQVNVPRLIKRFEKWLDMSESWNNDHPQTPTSPTVYRETHTDSVSPNSDDFYLPEFPLLPASRGFCLSLRKALCSLQEAMKIIIMNEH